MTASSFPDFITARRRELELTLGDVATRLGVSPITVSNWSSGDSTPNPENLLALAELLEVPPDELADMAGVTLRSASDGVNLLPAMDAEPDGDVAEPLTEETDISEPIAEMRLADSEDSTEPAEVELVNEPAAEVQIPDDFDEQAAPPAIAATEDVEPEPEPEPKPEPEPESDAEPEKSEPMGDAPDSVPAFMAAKDSTPEKAPAQKRRPALRRPRAAAAAAATERQVTTLPLTYIEDPKQLMRYRIRWALTVVILIIMFIILLWASRELLSALSEVKQAVTPGGIGGA
ncbi:MAG: helix-turn-helix transcriptional regulator [Acidimicrobiia bacterium]|nr:helix-turn-helix transcriptional regulator [Acidimicrobiia bacterium]